jgi:hypothetical protein
MMLVALVIAIAGAVPPESRPGAPAEPAYATPPAPEPADTISGWVVDANDWLDRGFVGTRHRQSAITSADLGEPLVLLTDAGSIIYPVTLTTPSGPLMDNVRLIPYAEQRILVTGRILNRSGERGIVVKGIARTQPAGQPGLFPAREVTGAKVLGRITALSCWLGQTDTGAAYVSCARARAATGEPLVLVTDSGRMYYPVTRDTNTDPADFTKLMKYLEQDVAVSGTVIARGRELGIAVDSVMRYTPTETLLPGVSK